MMKTVINIQNRIVIMCCRMLYSRACNMAGAFGCLSCRPYTMQLL